jgi:hypothetical protein
MQPARTKERRELVPLMVVGSCGWLGTYIPMMFWVANFHQTITTFVKLFYKIYLETCVFSSNIHHFCKIMKLRFFFFQPSYLQHCWFIISQAFPKWIKNL